jgi:hypothetical protein
MIWSVSTSAMGSGARRPLTLLTGFIEPPSP